MLKNSLNLYAENSDKAIQKMQAILTAGELHGKHIDALIIQLNSFATRIEQNALKEQTFLALLKRRYFKKK